MHTHNYDASATATYVTQLETRIESLKADVKKVLENVSGLYWQAVPVTTELAVLEAIVGELKFIARQVEAGRMSDAEAGRRVASAMSGYSHLATAKVKGLSQDGLKQAREVVLDIAMPTHSQEEMS